MKKIDYQPIVFGELCEKRCTADRGLARSLARHVDGSVLLPFAVESRHLKNVIITMKLMDIAGLVVTGGHRKRIVKHMPKLDGSARRSGMVDTVARRGRSFTGYCVEEMALSKWRESTRSGTSRGRRPSPQKLARLAREIRVELLTSAAKINRL